MRLALVLGLVATLVGLVGMAIGAIRKASNWRDMVVGGSTTFLLGMTLVAGQVIPAGLVRAATQWVLLAGVVVSLIFEVRIARHFRKTSPVDR
jgi:hypothetical protein